MDISDRLMYGTNEHFDDEVEHGKDYHRETTNVAHLLQDCSNLKDDDKLFGITYETLSYNLNNETGKKLG
ncbi:unnamed protein product [Onchocerca flexuosa]|uniref:Uncharacterized protein n=1 Tax=Onchocerca flexuosa TaxID=387005 RepID=A0A183I7S6_9BILA|nr:unnamed protein product [Onchocerca flexuosa]